MDLQQNNIFLSNRHINWKNKTYKAGRSKIKQTKPHSFTPKEMEERWQKTLINLNGNGNQTRAEKAESMRRAFPINKSQTKRKIYSPEELKQLNNQRKCQWPLVKNPPIQVLKECSKTPRDRCKVNKNNGPKTKNYKIMHHNTGGLARETVAEINHQLEINDIDILCINETKLKPSKQVNLYGYSCIARKDRPTTGGGVAIYAKTILNVEQINYPTNEELVIVELKTNRNQKINIISIYNPPNSELDVDVLLDAAGLCPKTIILGDLNAKHTSLHSRVTNRSGINLLNMMANTNLIIVNNNEPTHVHSRGAPDRLDLAISTPQLIPHIRDFSVGELEAINGHAPITVTINLENHQQATTDRPPPFNYERADWLKFRNKIEQNLIQTGPLQTPAQLDEAVKQIIKIITEATGCGSRDTIGTFFDVVFLPFFCSLAGQMARASLHSF